MSPGWCSSQAQQGVTSDPRIGRCVIFTGIVRGLATIQSIEDTPSGKRLLVSREPLEHTPEAGASVCHSGVCLTVAAIQDAGATLAYDVIPETLACTTLGELQPGHRVNVEPSLRVGDELGGHLVAGHVDTVGTVLAVDESDGYVVRVGVPAELALFFAPKGSVSLDGISLTVVDAGDDFLSVALIPETLRRTTAGAWVPGSRINVEVDTMARYAARLLGKL